MRLNVTDKQMLFLQSNLLLAAYRSRLVAFRPLQRVLQAATLYQRYKANHARTYCHCLTH